VKLLDSNTQRSVAWRVRLSIDCHTSIVKPDITLTSIFDFKVSQTKRCQSVIK
jgi:hypothetical protein